MAYRGRGPEANPWHSLPLPHALALAAFIAMVLLAFVGGVTALTGGSFMAWLQMLLGLGGSVPCFLYLWNAYSPRQQAGTLYEAEQRVGAALSDAQRRFDRLERLRLIAPQGADHAAAGAALAQAHHLLSARLDTLGRARFDLRLVWWKNRIDAALDDEAAEKSSAHETLERLSTLRSEAEDVLATLGPNAPDAYADVRGPLRDGVTALHALTARLFDESVAEAVAGITAPLDAPSSARMEVQAALAELAAVAEASTALARADSALAAEPLARETIRLGLEAADLAEDAAHPAARERA